MSKKKSDEARRIDRGEVIVRHATLDDGTTEFDEIVAYGCDVHLEKMDTNQFSLIVYGRKETVFFMLGAKRAPVDGWEVGREKPPGKKKR